MRYSHLRDGFRQVDVAVISRTFPRVRVNEALSKFNKSGVRNRDLPRDLLVYYIICLGLFMHASLQEVFIYMIEGLRYISDFSFGKIIGKSGISQARSGLGFEVMEHLHDEFVKPIATKETVGAWYKDLRLVAIDGSVLDLADEDIVRKEFGGPKGGAFPQVRMVALFECGTHVIFGSKLSPYEIGEKTLAKQVIKNLTKGMLCLADRGFHSFEFFNAAKEQGAELLFRALGEAQFDVEEVLPDGSYLSTLTNYKMRKTGKSGIKVRVIDYEITEQTSQKPYRLITTLMDYKQMPAHELAHLYHERWEAESILDELKTHLRGGCRVRLRSKTIELIKQEFYGLIMAHFAIRGIMHEAALANKIDPDILSFTHAIHIIRRKIPTFAAFPPKSTSQTTHPNPPRNNANQSSIQ